MIRFRLRSLLFLTTLGCVLAGAYGYATIQARKQSKAMLEAQSCGWNLGYDYQFRPSAGDLAFTKATWLTPNWYTRVLGTDFLNELKYAESVFHTENAPKLDQVMPFAEIEALRIGCFELGEIDLSLIGVFNDLRFLCLSNLKMAQFAGLVGELCNLEVLDLSGTDITDQCLVHIGKLGRLRSLAISSTKITDRGIEHLAQLQTIECLMLDDTKVSNSCFFSLKKLKNLKSLSLSGTNVNDDGFSEIAQLQNVEWLNLANTGVTATGFDQIDAMPSLRIVVLQNTAVTLEDKRILERKFPGCKALVDPN